VREATTRSAQRECGLRILPRWIDTDSIVRSADVPAVVAFSGTSCRLVESRLTGLHGPKHLRMACPSEAEKTQPKRKWVETCTPLRRQTHVRWRFIGARAIQSFRAYSSRNDSIWERKVSGLNAALSWSVDLLRAAHDDPCPD